MKLEGWSGTWAFKPATRPDTVRLNETGSDWTGMDQTKIGVYRRNASSQWKYLMAEYLAQIRMAHADLAQVAVMRRKLGVSLR